MAVRCGSDLRSSVRIDGGWVLIDTRTDGITLTNEQVDTSTKSGTSWRDLTACGVRNHAVSISGVSYSDDANVLGYLNRKAWAGEQIEARISSGDGEEQEVIAEGLFHITSLARTGETFAAESFELSIESVENTSYEETLNFGMFIDIVDQDTGDTISQETEGLALGIPAIVSLEEYSHTATIIYDS